MKTQLIVTAATLAVLFTGCAGVSPMRIVGDTIGGAGGALLGSTLGKRNPLISAAGAGAGVLLSESLQAGSSAAAKKSYAAGYEKGQSDCAKQRYQTLIDQQRQPAGGAEQPATVFDIPLPEREVGGAILTPSTRTLRIQE